MPKSLVVRRKSSVIRKPKKSRVLTSKRSCHSVTVLSSRTKSQNEEEFLSKEYDSFEHLLQEFDSFYNQQVEKHRQGYEKACEQVKKMISESLQTLPESLKFASVHDDTIECSTEDQNNDPNRIIKSFRERNSRRHNSDETVEFKKPTARHGVRTASRQRSASAEPALPTNNGFKTPLMSPRDYTPGQTITPKFYSNTPMSVMRRPLHGEVAISMSGSPLLVGAVSREDIPTVNVPLQDGRVFSIMPELGAPPEDLPGFDETTKKYLKTLRHHLEILAPSTP